jgi:acetylornithine/succinyldiaminopimelate/putrescine aminotransferase
MAACRVCRKNITSTQARSAVTMKDEKGRPTGMAHGKCKRLADKHVREAADIAAGTPKAGHDAPTVYEAAKKFGDERRTDAEYALARAANEDLAAEREKDIDERRHDDWRSDGSHTASLDDLHETTDEVLDMEDL